MSLSARYVGSRAIPTPRSTASRSTTSEFTRITFTSSDNANKLSPVLITPQTSGGEESFRYLLQPNLLLR